MFSGAGGSVTWGEGRWSSIIFVSSQLIHRGQSLVIGSPYMTVPTCSSSSLLWQKHLNSLGASQSFSSYMSDIQGGYYWKKVAISENSRNNLKASLLWLYSVQILSICKRHWYTSTICHSADKHWRTNLSKLLVSGNYCCHENCINVELGEFQQTYFCAAPVARLTVVVQEGQLIALGRGSSVSVHCQWERDSQALDQERMFPLANGSLLLVNVRTSDEGSYHCRQSSSYGGKDDLTASFQLQVYSESI